MTVVKYKIKICVKKWKGCIRRLVKGWGVESTFIYYEDGIFLEI
jgi:hypothetical protein